MPLYTYRCPRCAEELELLRPVSQRRAQVLCPSCRSFMQKTVILPVVRTFEPYFDEGLGSDVYSESDRRALMKERGVIEAGDPVHGGRNFDPKAPDLVKKQPLQGIRPKVSRSGDFPVETVDGAGKTVSRGMFSELPSA